MEALKKKWNSSRGASILLALLCLLGCMMVGASILMAAASNVGKAESNRSEQQKYLIVSSAMTMLIDELQRVEYVGLYTYKGTPTYIYFNNAGQEVSEDEALDDEGNLEMETDDEGNELGQYRQEVRFTTHTYIQQKGDLRQRTDKDKGTWLDTVLPLRSNLDYIFGRYKYASSSDEDEHFGVPSYRRDPEAIEDVYNCEPLPLDNTEPGDPKNYPTEYSGPYTLTFTDNYNTDDPYTVSIEFKLRTDDSILLTATLADGDKTDFTMMALLRLDPDEKTDGWLEQRLVLPNDPNKVDSEGSYLYLEDSSTNTYRTEKIRWKLEYIFKQEKEAKPSETPTIS